MSDSVRPAPPWHIDRLIIDVRTWAELLSATKQGQERGGLLIGDRDPIHQCVRVLGFLFPDQHQASAAYCEFDMRWVSLMRAALMTLELDQQVTIVAWIHTHPNLSVFLSGTDVNTIDSLQAFNPLLLAVVLDPFARDIGAFHMQRGTRDTQIDIQPIPLDNDFAAHLHKLQQAPQLRGAEHLHVVPSSDLAPSSLDPSRQIQRQSPSQRRVWIIRIRRP